MGFGGVGVKEFVKLEDTPASYTGEQSKLVAVKAAEDGVEFIAAPGVTSLGKFTEAEVLTGAVKLKEGTNIAITRVDADNALQIATAGAEEIGFDRDYIITYDPVEQLDKPLWRSDEIGLSIRGDGHKIIVESRALYTWQAWQSLTMLFSAVADDDHATSLGAFFGMNYGPADIYADWEVPHIGVYCSNNLWYATNGDYLGRQYTQIDTYTADSPMPFKIVRSVGDIKWYRNGVLKVTHTLNIPIFKSGYKEHYSARSSAVTRRGIRCQHIKFISGIYP